MLDMNISYISWISFFMIGIIILLLWVSVKLLFNYFLRSFSHTQKIVSFNNLVLADRVFRIILAIILIIAFILVNPIVNGTLVALLLIIGYSILTDIMFGITIIHKLNLLRENYIVSGEHAGSIEKLRWLGLILKQNHKHKYVPYSYLYKHGFVQKENNYTFDLKFKCTDSVSRDSLNEAIRKKLFMLPFTAKDTLPEVLLNDHGFELKLDIINPKFEESIINAIEEISLENTTIKAI